MTWSLRVVYFSLFDGGEAYAGEDIAACEYGYACGNGLPCGVFPERVEGANEAGCHDEHGGDGD